jgi:hypothetical protein
VGDGPSTWKRIDLKISVQEPGVFTAHGFRSHLDFCSSKLNDSSVTKILGEISGSYGGEYENDCLLGCCVL